MFSNPASLAIAALSAIAYLTQPAHGQSSSITQNKPPTLTPFFHIDLRVTNSTFATATDGLLTGQANNQGGTITGGITGQVLKLGTEIETFRTVGNASELTYNNIFTLNTTDGVPILMTVDGNIQLILPHLHGFARMSFSTSAAAYQYLTYGNYVAEFQSMYGTGHVSVDVFELKTSGSN